MESTVSCLKTVLAIIFNILLSNRLLLSSNKFSNCQNLETMNHWIKYTDQFRTSGLYPKFIYLQPPLLSMTILCINLMLCITGTKPVLGPNCMIPYIYIYLYMWYHTGTVPTQNGLSPCVMYWIFFRLGSRSK